MCRNFSVEEVVAEAVLARNTHLTYGGKTAAEIMRGHSPTDDIHNENMNPPQLCGQADMEGYVPATLEDRRDFRIREEALKAYLKARQSMDIRRDPAARMQPSQGCFKHGESIWYWEKDMNKIRGGEWIRGRVQAVDGNSFRFAMPAGH